MAKKILIIDDEQNIVMALTALIEHTGDVQVASALNPETGVEKAKSWQPDAVLMDIYMPKIDGWEATRRIKTADETKHIPVIIMTAVLSNELIAQVGECGADRLIVKPCDDRDIRRLLDWLDK
ncbi:MAG: response regulator [Elusimicrobiota bacterium]